MKLTIFAKKTSNTNGTFGNDKNCPCGNYRANST